MFQINAVHESLLMCVACLEANYIVVDLIGLMKWLHSSLALFKCTCQINYPGC